MIRLYNKYKLKYNLQSIFLNDFAIRSNKTKVFSKLELKYDELVKFKFFNKTINDSELLPFYKNIDTILDKHGVELDENLFKNKIVIKEMKDLYNGLSYGINNSSICMAMTQYMKKIN